MFIGVDAKGAFSLTRSTANEYVQFNTVDIAMFTVHLHVFDEEYS